MFVANRLQQLATWLYDTSMGTHLDYNQKLNVGIWSVKYLLENPNVTWEDFKNQFLTSPCEKLQKVGKNDVTKNAMKNLKTKTGDNKEHAYLLWESNNQINDDLYFQSLPNQPGIAFTFDPGDKFVAFIHSHYDDPKLLSTFSFDDFLTIISLKQYGAIKDENSFVMGVTTGSNTQYYMMIDNPTKFNSFVSRFYENGILNQKEIDKFGEFYELNVSFKKSTSENENSLVNFLELLGTGIKLFKGDSQMENWQALERSSDGTIVAKNCN